MDTTPKTSCCFRKSGTENWLFINNRHWHLKNGQGTATKIRWKLLRKNFRARHASLKWRRNRNKYADNIIQYWIWELVGWIDRGKVFVRYRNKDVKVAVGRRITQKKLLLHYFNCKNPNLRYQASSLKKEIENIFSVVIKFKIESECNVSRTTVEVNLLIFLIDNRTSIVRTILLWKIMFISPHNNVKVHYRI